MQTEQAPLAALDYFLWGTRLLSVVGALLGLVALLAPKVLYAARGGGKPVLGGLFAGMPEPRKALVGRAIGLILMIQVVGYFAYHGFDRQAFFLLIPKGTNYEGASQPRKQQYYAAVLKAAEGINRENLNGRFKGLRLDASKLYFDAGVPEELWVDLEEAGFYGLSANQVAGFAVQKVMEQVGGGDDEEQPPPPPMPRSGSEFGDEGGRRRPRE